MQYILSKAELNDLVPIEKIISRTKALAKANETILKLANFTCIHDIDSSSPYCDDCPVSFKAWGNESSNLICASPKNYSK